MLKSTSRHPPGGWIYKHPATEWSPQPHMPFEHVVGQIARHRAANPLLLGEWPTEHEIIAIELQHYTATRLGNHPLWCLPPVRDAEGRYVIDGDTWEEVERGHIRKCSAQRAANPNANNVAKSAPVAVARRLIAPFGQRPRGCKTCGG